MGVAFDYELKFIKDLSFPGGHFIKRFVSIFHWKLLSATEILASDWLRANVSVSPPPPRLMKCPPGCSNIQVLCPHYSHRAPMKAMFHWQMCGANISNLSSLKAILDNNWFHTFLLLFRFKSEYGCPISYKITKLHLTLHIIQLPRRIEIISNSVLLLNYPFK